MKVHRRMNAACRLATIAVALSASFAAAAQGQDGPGKVLQTIAFDQKLDAQVPLDLSFRDETGASAPLTSYFNHKRPVILALVYYQCPMLCSQVLNGLTRGLRPLALELGSDYDILTVSIDPKDTPEVAALKKANYLKSYGREGRAAGWHFLTGDPKSIEVLAESVGFRYSFNPATGQYAHAAGIVVLTPGGRVARYFYGIDFSPRDLQFGLVEAAAGRIGSRISKMLLLCYDYDAATGKYTLSILRFSQVLGVVTALGVGLMVALLLRRERRQRASASAGANTNAAAAST